MAIYIILTITFLIVLSIRFKVSEISEKVKELEENQRNHLYLMKRMTDLMQQLIDRK